MCNCKYYDERFVSDPEDGKEWSYCVCLHSDNYFGHCVAEDGDRCDFRNTCHNIAEENPVDEFVCSKCGIHLYDWIRVRDEDYYEYEFKYCPNCGAKVVEENK